MSRTRSPQEWEEWRREVALFRYALVRDLADPDLSSRQRGRLARELAGREHVGPDGRPARVGRSTIDDWLRLYRAGGYQALVPTPRKVLARTPARVLELAIALKRENPDRTAAQIHAILTAAGETGVPAARTLQTHLSRAGLNQRADGRTPSKVYGRFEATAPNELWTGDGLHGPKLASTGRRAVLLAFIDDHSRMLVGWRWVSGEDVFGLEAALRPALMARGVPEAVLVDRGSAFVSSNLLRACAVLRAKLIHASPRAATTKGKIERFFRTCRDRFLVEIADRDDVELSSSTGSSAHGWRSSITSACIRRPARPRSPDSRPLRRWCRRRRSCCARRSCGQRTEWSPRPRPCRYSATTTKSTPPWSAAAASCSLIRSTSPSSRSAIKTGPSGSPNRFRSTATSTREPYRWSSRRRRRPGLTTSACWPLSATPNWPASASTTRRSLGSEPEPDLAPDVEDEDEESER